MKTQLYPFRSLLFILLSFSCAETINAQGIDLMVENWTTGGNGSLGGPGDKLIYYIEVTGPQTMINPKVACPIPPGTVYVPNSTTLNGTAFTDQNGTMPWATANLIPVPLPPANKVTIQFEVTIVATGGTIEGKAELQTVNYPLATSEKETTLQIDPLCRDFFYSLTTSLERGYDPFSPGTYYPFKYLRELNRTTGNSSTIAYNGTNGLCKNAYTQADLPSGTILTDAVAMTVGRWPYRVYFVNKPINNQPADLCYISPDFNNPATSVAYQYVNTPLTTNTTSLITRMTMDAGGNGYAITDNGQEFIHFSVDALTDDPIIDAPTPLINDPANGAHDVLAEAGGDICCDGSGKLILIPNSGNVYRINPINKMATWLGTIANFPAGGCNSVVIDDAGSIYIGGFYRALYKLTLSTMTLTTVTTLGTYASSDFAGCAIPTKPARVATNENAVPDEPRTAQLSNEVFARVQPNPFKGMLNAQVKVNIPQAVKVRLIDFYGRIVYAGTEKLNAGFNSLNISVPEKLGSGMYVLELWAGNKQLLHKKLLKQ